MKEEIRLDINEKIHRISVSPYKPLRDVLRYDLCLTGTKESCDTGVCGVCTILIGDKAVKSCLVPVGKVVGEKITTIEGISNEEEFSLLQQSFIDCFASQCGYCIPGFIMASTSLLIENPDPTIQEIREGLSGNLCRCTGYVKIIDAVKRAAEMGVEKI
tara:strand:- start:13906 stop:14382 length:477 start_codon:yes stop_codon:yes gene_type:complete